MMLMLMLMVMLMESTRIDLMLMDLSNRADVRLTHIQDLDCAERLAQH